jgi:hypothetical protein
MTENNRWEVSADGYLVVRGGQGTAYPAETIASCSEPEWAKKIAKALNQMEADK